MMSLTSVHAYQGLERAFADAGRAAETFVSSFAARASGGVKLGLRSDQTVRAATDLLKAKIAAKANGKSMRAGDQMTGSLLDILV